MSEQTTLYLSRDKDTSKRNDFAYYCWWPNKPKAICNEALPVTYSCPGRAPLFVQSSRNFHYKYPASLHLKPGQLAKLTINMEIIK